MSPSEKVKYISNWIKSYVDQMPVKAQSLVVGISSVGLSQKDEPSTHLYA